MPSRMLGGMLDGMLNGLLHGMLDGFVLIFDITLLRFMDQLESGLAF